MIGIGAKNFIPIFDAVCVRFYIILERLFTIVYPLSFECLSPTTAYRESVRVREREHERESESETGEREKEGGREAREHEGVRERE